MHYHIYDSSNLNTVSAVSKVMYVSCLQSKGEPKICISTIGDGSNTTVQHYPKRSFSKTAFATVVGKVISTLRIYKYINYSSMPFYKYSYAQYQQNSDLAPRMRF